MVMELDCPIRVSSSSVVFVVGNSSVFLKKKSVMDLCLCKPGPAGADVPRVIVKGSMLAGLKECEGTAALSLCLHGTFAHSTVSLRFGGLQ